MKQTFSWNTIIVAGLLLGAPLAVSPTNAAILLNFGATVSDDANSPAHEDGGVSGTHWNLIAADKLTGIVDDAGTSTTLAVNLGRESSGTSNTIDFNSDTFNNRSLGTQYNLGIYAGNAKSATYTDADISIGARLSGLAAGSYNVFTTGRNTNNFGAGTYYFRVAAISSSTGSTYDFSSLPQLAEATSSDKTASNATWEAGIDYVKGQVTLTAGQDLLIIGDGATDNRGFFNTIEITAVPEPASLSLLALGGLTLLRRRRRGCGLRALPLR
jgi:hypothetical protein